MARQEPERLLRTACFPPRAQQEGPGRRSSQSGTGEVFWVAWRRHPGHVGGDRRCSSRQCAWQILTSWTDDLRQPASRLGRAWPRASEGPRPEWRGRTSWGPGLAGPASGDGAPLNRVFSNSSSPFLCPLVTH